jgi:hypothetical protein
MAFVQNMRHNVCLNAFSLFYSVAQDLHNRYYSEDIWRLCRSGLGNTATDPPVSDLLVRTDLFYGIPTSLFSRVLYQERLGISSSDIPFRCSFRSFKLNIFSFCLVPGSLLIRGTITTIDLWNLFSELASLNAEVQRNETEPNVTNYVHTYQRTRTYYVTCCHILPVYLHNYVSMNIQANQHTCL